MIAAALLLVTIAAVTICVAGVSRAGARLEETMDRDRALRRVSERLGVLPFCAVSYPQVGAQPGDPAHDLLAAVFPHARSARNTPLARYVAVDGDGVAPAGSFVTTLTEDGVQVTCVARFLAGPDEPALGADDLDGWDAATATAPPAPAVSVELTLEGGGRGVTLVRSAMAEAPIAAPVGGGWCRMKPLRNGCGSSPAPEAGLHSCRIAGRRRRRHHAAERGIRLALERGGARGATDDGAQAATLAAAASRAVAADVHACLRVAEPPSARDPSRSLALVHDHAAVAAEVVLIVWDPGRGVVWRNASGTYLADHIARFSVAYVLRAVLSRAQR